VVVDQLSEDCAAITGMLGSLQKLEAADAATTAAAAAGNSRSTRVSEPFWHWPLATRSIFCTKPSFGQAESGG
jgi:hypothetical protein